MRQIALLTGSTLTAALPDMNASTKGATLVCLAMLLYTMNDAMLKLIGDSLPIGEVMILRGIAAGVVLTVVMRVTGVGFSLRQLLAPMAVIRALCDATASILFVFALLDLPIAVVTAFIQTVPILSSLAGALIFSEPISRGQYIALALCMAGVLAITGLVPVTDPFALAVMLGAIALMVLRDLATRKADPTLPSITMALSSTVAVTVLSLLCSAPASWQMPGALQSRLILATALCVGIATLLFVIAMRITTLARIAPFRYSAMVFAVLTGALLWNEQPGPLTLLGAALIIAGGTVGSRAS